MKMKVLAAALLLSSSGLAFSADAVVEEIPVAVEIDAFSWTGFYIGAKAGYGWGNGDYNAPIAPGLSYDSESDLDGFLIGAYAGAQYQFSNNVVLGVEIDVDYRNADDASPFIYNPSGIDPFAGGIDLHTEINWTASTRLRAGYAMDRWLPYITGGFAFADYDAQVRQLGVPLVLPGMPTSFSDTSVGWTLGVGTEYAFTDNIIFRAEYRYSDFGDAESYLTFPAPVPGQSFELDSHDITLGVSWKF